MLCQPRNIFPEAAYRDDMVTDMTVKKLARGAQGESDAFLNWLELGAFDALEKTYVRTWAIADEWFNNTE